MSTSPMRLIRPEREGTREVQLLPTDEIVGRYLDSVARYAVKEDRIPLSRRLLRIIERIKKAIW